MENSNEWKPLMSLFANADTRSVAAEMMLGASLDTALTDLSASKRRKVTSTLVRSGMIDAETHAFVPEIFRAVLAAAQAPQPQGLDRFLEGTRIRQYPANLDERGELLTWVARDAFTPEEVLSEREVNDRLRPYHQDVAVLRRYLVDYALLERSPDGTEYALVAQEPSA